MEVRFGCGDDHRYSSRTAYEVLDSINKGFNETVFCALHNHDTDSEEYILGYAEWLKKSLSEYIDATLEKYMHFIASDSVNEEK